MTELNKLTKKTRAFVKIVMFLYFLFLISNIQSGITFTGQSVNHYIPVYEEIEVEVVHNDFNLTRYFSSNSIEISSNASYDPQVYFDTMYNYSGTLNWPNSHPGNKGTYHSRQTAWEIVANDGDCLTYQTNNFTTGYAEVEYWVYPDTNNNYFGIAVNQSTTMRSHSFAWNTDTQLYYDFAGKSRQYYTLGNYLDQWLWVEQWINSTGSEITAGTRLYDSDLNLIWEVNDTMAYAGTYTFYRWYSSPFNANKLYYIDSFNIVGSNGYVDNSNQIPVKIYTIDYNETIEIAESFNMLCNATISIENLDYACDLWIQNKKTLAFEDYSYAMLYPNLFITANITIGFFTSESFNHTINAIINLTIWGYQHGI